jgi:hypothetical protein
VGRSEGEAGGQAPALSRFVKCGKGVSYESKQRHVHDIDGAQYCMAQGKATSSLVGWAGAAIHCQLAPGLPCHTMPSALQGLACIATTWNPATWDAKHTGCWIWHHWKTHSVSPTPPGCCVEGQRRCIGRAGAHRACSSNSNMARCQVSSTYKD